MSINMDIYGFGKQSFNYKNVILNMVTELLF